MRTHIKETSKSVLLVPCEGNSPVTGEFPHKGPVTRKKLPFYDVIMINSGRHVLMNNREQTRH